jgi:peptidoglycan/LPS O-acetylase OafA/YrhL
MENELPPDHLKSLWQNHNLEPVQMSLEEIRQKAEGFQNIIRRRNLREYVAAAFVFAGVGYGIWRFPGMRLACGLLLTGTIYVLYQLHTRGAAKRVPESLALDTCLEFHRRELERQRDLARDVLKWYLLPFVPGLLAVLAVPLLHQPPEKWIRAAPVLLLWAAMFYAVLRLNKRGADKLQRQIDELNSMNRESR